MGKTKWVGEQGYSRSKMIVDGFEELFSSYESKQVVHSLNLPKVLAGFDSCICAMLVL